MCGEYRYARHAPNYYCSVATHLVRVEPTQQKTSRKSSAWQGSNKKTKQEIDLFKTAYKLIPSEREG